MTTIAALRNASGMGIDIDGLDKDELLQCMLSESVKVRVNRDLSKPLKPDFMKLLSENYMDADIIDMDISKKYVSRRDTLWFDREFGSGQMQRFINELRAKDAQLWNSMKLWLTAECVD